MKIVVQKFGGTSVKDDEARHTAMKHVAYAVKKGFKAAVVVSAIGRKGAPYATDSLLELVGNENRSSLRVKWICWFRSEKLFQLQFFVRC